MEINLQKTIDQSIKAQYQDICFNPEKREVLWRMAQQRYQYLESSTTQFSQNESFSEQQLMDNQLLNTYIQHVYNKYNLEDPINKSLRQNNCEEILEKTINTPGRQTGSAKAKSSKLNSTQKKLLQMRKNYQKGSIQIVANTEDQNAHHKRQSQSSVISSSRVSKQIGYKTREKIVFKTHYKQSDSSGNSPIAITNVNNQGSPREVSQFIRPEQAYIVQQPVIRSPVCVPVKFRYCPMCEVIILQQNIKHHESVCKEVQQSYKLPIEQLKAKILGKISRMQAQIRRGIAPVDVNNVNNILGQHYSLNQSVSQWLVTESDSSFDKVRQNYQNLVLNKFDLIAKLHWFRQLYSRIVSGLEKGEGQRVQ